jgi:hypothetical protein
MKNMVPGGVNLSNHEQNKKSSSCCWCRMYYCNIRLFSNNVLCATTTMWLIAAVVGLLPSALHFEIRLIVFKNRLIMLIKWFQICQRWCVCIPNWRGSFCLHIFWSVALNQCSGFEESSSMLLNHSKFYRQIANKTTLSHISWQFLSGNTGVSRHDSIIRYSTGKKMKNLLWRTGWNNVMLPILVILVNNIVQHCYTRFRLHEQFGLQNIVQSCCTAGFTFFAVRIAVSAFVYCTFHTELSVI